MLGDIEEVAIDIRRAGLGIGPSIGSLFRQLVGIVLFQPLDDFFPILHFEAEVIQAVGRLLLVVGQNRQIEVTVGEINRTAFLFVFVKICISKTSM